MVQPWLTNIVARCDKGQAKDGGEANLLAGDCHLGVNTQPINFFGSDRDGGGRKVVRARLRPGRHTQRITLRNLPQLYSA
jgi:hypothetical protein